MTIIDLVHEAPILVQVLIVILIAYLISWFPRVIGALGRILQNLIALNKNIQSLDSDIQEYIKRANYSQISTDLIAKLLSNRKDDKEKIKND